MAALAWRLPSARCWRRPGTANKPLYNAAQMSSPMHYCQVMGRESKHTEEVRRAAQRKRLAAGGGCGGPHPGGAAGQQGGALHAAAGRAAGRRLELSPLPRGAAERRGGAEVGTGRGVGRGRAPGAEAGLSGAYPGQSPFHLAPPTCAPASGPYLGRVPGVSTQGPPKYVPRDRPRAGTLLGCVPVSPGPSVLVPRLASRVTVEGHGLRVDVAGHPSLDPRARHQACRARLAKLARPRPWEPRNERGTWNGTMTIPRSGCLRAY